MLLIYLYTVLLSAVSSLSAEAGKPVHCVSSCLFWANPPSFLLPSSTLQRCFAVMRLWVCRLACTTLWLASLQSTTLLLCVGAGALDCICFSPGPRLSLPTPLINSVLTPLSPSPLSICPGPAASHPHSNITFFYDFSTNRAVSSPFSSSVLPLVATVLSTTWLTIHSPGYLDFNYVN